MLRFGFPTVGQNGDVRRNYVVREVMWRVEWDECKGLILHILTCIHIQITTGKQSLIDVSKYPAHANMYTHTDNYR